MSSAQLNTNQLQIVQQTTGLKVSKMHIYYPKEENGNPKISFSFNPDNVVTSIQNYDEVAHKIETKDFFMLGLPATKSNANECDMVLCNKY